MSTLTIHRKQFLKIGIPYWIYIDGRELGIMKGEEVNINLPAGEYNIAIRIVLILFKWQFHIGGSRKISVDDNTVRHLWITDKERVWNILFDIDLVLWIAEFFFTLPYPWKTVYDILSNGFFAIWLLRIWIIRNSYFIISDSRSK